MGEVFVISDTHFGHDNIIKYCNRPFKNAAEQDEALIANWNAAVSPKDTVIHCGDFIMGLPENIESIVPRLNGNIILVRGNHDTKARLKKYTELFSGKVDVRDMYYLSYKGKYFVFSHMPISNEEYLQMIVGHNKEIVMCHGHLHNTSAFYDEENKMFNCSIENLHYSPININFLWKYCIGREEFR